MTIVGDNGQVLPETSPIPFDFEGSSVRLIDKDGAPWFVLADVCKALDILNPSNIAARLDDDEKATLHNMEGQAGSGAQTFTIVNESGLYSLILRSRKPAAKRFKKWVTAEMLPSIRKLVDGRDPMSLWTFLRESVPVENLHIALDVVAWRSAVALKYGPKGIPFPEAVKAPIGRFAGKRR